jgi:hypothetical protein
LTWEELVYHQHQEKKGLLFWKRCVNVSLKERKRDVVPTWPLDLEI